MKRSKWLEVLHQQWLTARGGRADAAARSFRRDWEKLLDDAGVARAEDRQAAVREAEKEQALGHVKLHGLKGRAYLVQKIEIPLEAESWWHEQFGSRAGSDRQQRSLEVLHHSFDREHPLLPELWTALGQSLMAAFTAAKTLGPFSWREPERVTFLLSLLFDVTSWEWPRGTLLRDASVSMGYDSKLLEVHQAVLARALELLFGREMPLEALGIQTSNSTLHFSGSLTLHFENGESHATDFLRFESTLPVAEIERALRITTTAERLLTVENRKTTFLQLARADTGRSTLIIATSFPSQAVRLLLEKISVDLPHHHFGDTDPAGWDILRCLREVTPRPVMPFFMKWRPSAKASTLTSREKQILARLLADPCMTDCAGELRQMLESGTRGDFEQESLGSPDLACWPFYSAERMVHLRLETPPSSL